MSGNEDSLDAIRAELTDGDAVGVTEGPGGDSGDAGGFQDELSGGVVDQPDETDTSRDPTSETPEDALGFADSGGVTDGPGGDVDTQPDPDPRQVSGPGGPELVGDDVDTGEFVGDDVANPDEVFARNQADRLAEDSVGIDADEIGEVSVTRTGDGLGVSGTLTEDARRQERQQRRDAVNNLLGGSVTGGRPGEGAAANTPTAGPGGDLSTVEPSGPAAGADGAGVPESGDTGADQQGAQGQSFRQAESALGSGTAAPTSEADAAEGSPIAGTDQAVGEAVDTAVEAVEDSPVADAGAAIADASRGAAGFANRNVVEPAAGVIGEQVEVGSELLGTRTNIDTETGEVSVENAPDLDNPFDAQPETGLGQATEGVVAAGGRGATGATLGAPAGAVETANIAGQGLEFTGEQVAEQGFQEGATAAAEAGVNTAQSAADAAVTAATERPLRTGAALLGGGLGAVGGGVGLGRAVRGARQRSRTVGGTDVELPAGGDDTFPGIDDPDALREDPAAAVASQADRTTPDVIADQFDQAGVEGSDLVKALDVEPGGPARRRTAQGLQTPEADSDLAGEFETAGTSVGPELSENFLRIEGSDTSRSFSLRPGVPDLDPGGQPTAVFVRTDVENPDADTTAELDTELREAEGDTTARAIQPGMEGFDPVEEAEAQLPPGAEFADVGTGPLRDAARRVGIGADFRTEIDGQTVPIRTVAPEGDLNTGSPNLFGVLDDDRGRLGGGGPEGSRVSRTLDTRRGGDTDVVDRPIPTVGGAGGSDGARAGGGSSTAGSSPPILDSPTGSPPVGGDSPGGSSPPGGSDGPSGGSGPPGDSDGPGGGSSPPAILGGGSSTSTTGGPTDPPGGGGGVLTGSGFPVLDPPESPPRRRLPDGDDDPQQALLGGGFTATGDTFDSGILDADDVLDA